VLFGPHMENFAVLTRALVANQAAIQIQDETGLQKNVAALLRDEQTAKRLVSNAWAIVERHRGAASRTGKLLTELKSGHSGCVEPLPGASRS